MASGASIYLNPTITNMRYTESLFTSGFLVSVPLGDYVLSYIGFLFIDILCFVFRKESSVVSG